MSGRSNLKKLKMERLSPIPALDWSHRVSNSVRTPVSSRTLHRPKNDAYAIETTSSPEFGQSVIDSSSAPKQRRYRNIARKVSNKFNSTPLAGLISRKSAGSTPKESLRFSDTLSSPTSNDMPAELIIPEELPQIDDYSPQKPPHSIRHSEIISASAIFPPKPQPSTSTTPLAGIVNKKASILDRSLNDSIIILRDAEDPSDEEIAPTAKPEKVSIENFESPRKHLLPNKFHADNFKICPPLGLSAVNLNKSSLIDISTPDCGEMCGNERKNRKRALDFNSSFFVAANKIDARDADKSQIFAFSHFSEADDKCDIYVNPETERQLSDNLKALQSEQELSDSDSIIESTPTTRVREDMGNFIASSDLLIENSPPGVSCKEDIPGIADILEVTEKCDLKFVVGDDTSDSTHDSDSCDVIFQKIDGRDSPLELNDTKRPIQSFESPSKAPKPFSEAVNIGAFGSPDSNASYEDPLDEQNDAEAIDPSTLEYIEESEQVRPAKRRKKGSLMERVKSVIAKVDASNALFDYEIKCGLRPVKGKSVSAPLVVLKRWGEITSLFLLCKPLKYCQSSSQIDDKSFILVHVNKSINLCDGSVVLLHFPLNVMYISALQIPCALAGHQIVFHPTEPKIDINAIDFPSVSIHSLAYSKPTTSFRSFSSAHFRTLREAELCQNLIEENNLHLTVMHVTKLPVDASLTKILVLCCDEELDFCWLEFSSERDVKRASALETLYIISDGSQVLVKGFSVAERVRLDRKSKQLLSYCSNNVVNNEIIFFVRPKQSNWIISTADSAKKLKKVCSSIKEILLEKCSGRRYLLEVNKIIKEPQITLEDSQALSINFVIGENSSVDLDHPAPFFLDGAYFYDNKLFSDEHTKMVVKI